MPGLAETSIRMASRSIHQLRGVLHRVDKVGSFEIDFSPYAGTTQVWTTVAYFDPGSVIWDLQSTDKFDAIREVVFGTTVFSGHPDLDVELFAERVLEREKLQSTGLGHGVAVAHGRTDQVLQPQIALGVSREGIDFDAFDSQPVHLIFVVANHPDDRVDYLHILSTLVEMVRDGMFRRELLNCSHADDAQQRLCGVFASLLEQRRLRFAC